MCRSPRSSSLLFLSTLPARGATCLPRLSQLTARFLSTLPARGATRSRRTRAGRHFPFLSTLPARGATMHLSKRANGKKISIHAPREGSDGLPWRVKNRQNNFYPRSPRGERRSSAPWTPCGPKNFYPRSPRGERPGRCPRPARRSAFLSTLPARGATWLPRFVWVSGVFLSTLPARGATSCTRRRWPWG